MTHHDLALERSYGLKCDADNDQDRCAADADFLQWVKFGGKANAAYHR